MLIHRVRPVQPPLATAIAVLALAGVLSTARGQSAAALPGDHLAPIAFLTGHEWEAKLSDTPDGKKQKIHAQFIWTQSHQAIRINNQLIVDGKPRPYVDGLYVWDPQQQVILFWYVSAEGSLSKGKVKADGATLVHDFEQTQPDGKTAKYAARVTPNQAGWQNEIFAQTEKGLHLIVSVQYEVAQ